MPITPNPPADFNKNFKPLGNFRFWCQKVLPLVYDDSLSYYELLCKVVDYLNKTMEDVETLNDAYNKLQEYVNNYFDSLDVTEEINNKLDSMANDGTLTELLLPYIQQETPPIFVDSTENMTNKNRIYVLSSNGHVYAWNGSSFYDTGLTYGDNNLSIDSYGTLINSANYSSLLPDFNNVMANTCYRMSFTRGSSNVPKNSPFGNKWGTGNVCLLLTTVSTYSKTGNFQLFFANNTIYWRSYSSNWGSWSILANYVESSYLECYKTLIGENNYTELLSDLNDINTPITYLLNFRSGSENIPLNTPYGNKWSFSGVALLLTFPIGSSGSSLGSTQYFIADKIYYRYRQGGGIYNEWKTIGNSGNGNSNIIYVGNSGDYTSILEAVLFATSNGGNYTIKVENGVYDLQQEFIDKYGSNFFENYNADSTKGIILSDGVKIIFSSNSKVIFNYSGNNSQVKQLFSPFNAGSGGFTIENMTLECSNCRYAIHDERNVDGIMYKNKYINCNIKIDNSNNNSWNSKQCIGGGLGICGEIIIDSCIFESIGINSETAGIVSYHNSNDNTAKSNVVIKNCYFKGDGTIRCSWYGTSTQKTLFLITNNSIGSAIIQRAENGESNVNNIEVIEFNNNMRG